MKNPEFTFEQLSLLACSVKASIKREEYFLKNATNDFVIRSIQNDIKRLEDIYKIIREAMV